MIDICMLADSQLHLQGPGDAPKVAACLDR